jgi:Reverse transcriptase (RNA-dependent DNA polymerase)
VAQGYAQRPGFEYAEDATFSPTYRPASLRLILALCAQKKLHLCSVDISAAFLLGTDITEEIYMRQPPGFHQGAPNMVCRLRKPLYGLKQSACNWNQKLHQVLTDMGFKWLESDRAVYIYARGDCCIIVPVFIDDITLAGTTEEENDKMIAELQKHCKLCDLGATEFLLGIAITCNWGEGTISLSQHQYILNILERFGMSDCKPVYTPIDPSTALTKDMCAKTEDEITEMQSVPYLQEVGSLMYLSTTTCPDISYAVGVLARFNSNPGQRHWLAVKHLMRYLKGTVDYKLVYGSGKQSQEVFTTYTDADYGGNKDNGRSTGGYVTSISGVAIGWRSTLQPFVTLSTTEAEYVAAVEAGKEIKWMRSILEEFGYPVNGASTLLIDNQSALSVSKTQSTMDK